MISAQRITFAPSSRRARDLSVGLFTWRLSLERAGYVIPRPSSQWITDDGERVVVHAVWTGRDAFKAQKSDPRVRPHWDDLVTALAEPPGVERMRVPVDTRSCRCTASTTRRYRLWCTPRSTYPPLLCAEDMGVVPFYRLPIDDDTLGSLRVWEDRVRPLADLWLAHDPDSPYRDWAREQLCDPAGWVATRSEKLAAELASQIGSAVLTAVPPVALHHL